MVRRGRGGWAQYREGAVPGNTEATLYWGGGVGGCADCREGRVPDNTGATDGERGKGWANCRVGAVKGNKGAAYGEGGRWVGRLNNDSISDCSSRVACYNN